MKQLIYSTLFIIGACLFMGCKSNSTPQVSATQADSLQVAGEVASNLVVDSLVSEAEQDSSVSCRIVIDYPLGRDSLATAVRNYLCQELGNHYLPLINDEGNAKKYPKYSPNANKDQNLVEFYGNGNFNYLQDQYKEMTSNIEDKDFKPQLNYEVKIKKTDDNDRYVTFRTTTYAYLAGAHGSAVDYSVNISKARKKPVTTIVNKQKLKKIQPILRQGVLDYLNADAEEKIHDENLNDYLFIDKGIIPLPTRTPYLTKDGVHFIYQQYEIGPYAMGMVEFTVPYTKIKPFLTEEALKLCKQ